MRAALASKAGQIDCVETTMPEPGPGQVLVRMHCCSLCGSDLHEVFMPLSNWTFPCAHGFPGHEGVGEVVESRADGIASGQRVLTVPDRSCSASFADYQVLDTQFVVPVGDAVRPEIVTLAQPLGAVIYGLKEFMPDDVPETAVVLGQGGIGIFFTWLLKRAGVAQVITSELQLNRRALSSRYGADTVVDPGKDSVVEAVHDLTEGKGAPLVVEAAGTDKTRFEAIEAVASQGFVGLFGLPDKEEIDRFPFNELFRKRAGMRSVFGSQTEPHHSSYLSALSMIEAGEIDLQPLLTHRFSLERIAEAFETAHHIKDEAVKISITVD